jgi:hypothetical protein
MQSLKGALRVVECYLVPGRPVAVFTKIVCPQKKFTEVHCGEEPEEREHAAE